MRLHYLQHVPFEGLGYIGEWATKRGLVVSSSRLFDGDQLPRIDAFEWLVVMGGPMGIYDHDEFPWLIAEKEFIRQAIDQGKRVLGICLGAQLIADVLGAKVYPGVHKEIGWHTLDRAPSAPEWFPERLLAFHWHGDTFDLPKDAVRMASSKSCPNQGFVYRERVVGLQFHLETTRESMEALIRHCAHELMDAPFIQDAETMRAGVEAIPRINEAMALILSHLAWPSPDRKRKTGLEPDQTDHRTPGRRQAERPRQKSIYLLTDNLRWLVGNHPLP